MDFLFDRGQVQLTPTATEQATRPSLFEQRPYERQTPSAVPADATLHLPHIAALLNLIRQPAGNVPLQGDMKVLQVFQTAVQQAEPDLFAPLQKAFGPQPAALAEQIVGGGLRHLRRTFSVFQRQTQENWLQENLLAPRWKMTQLTEATRALRTEIERLEAKLTQWEQTQQTDQTPSAVVDTSKPVEPL